MEKKYKGLVYHIDKISFFIATMAMIMSFISKHNELMSVIFYSSITVSIAAGLIGNHKNSSWLLIAIQVIVLLLAIIMLLTKSNII